MLWVRARYGRGSVSSSPIGVQATSAPIEAAAAANQISASGFLCCWCCCFSPAVFACAPPLCASSPRDRLMWGTCASRIIQQEQQRQVSIILIAAAHLVLSSGLKNEHTAAAAAYLSAPIGSHSPIRLAPVDIVVQFGRRRRSERFVRVHCAHSQVYLCLCSAVPLPLLVLSKLALTVCR